MNIEKQERINTNIKTRSKNEKVSIKISFSSNCSSNDELYKQQTHKQETQSTSTVRMTQTQPCTH